jgi:hypothetical protein
MARNLPARRIPHTIPLLMSIDETFDVGLDTRPEQLSAADKKAAEEALARARD